MFVHQRQNGPIGGRKNTNITVVTQMYYYLYSNSFIVPLMTSQHTRVCACVCCVEREDPQTHYRRCSSIRVYGSCFTGSRTSSVPLEQRVHPESDRGEHRQDPAHHVRQPLPHLQRALEPVRTCQSSAPYLIPSQFSSSHTSWTWSLVHMLQIPTVMFQKSSCSIYILITHWRSKYSSNYIDNYISNYTLHVSVSGRLCLWSTTSWKLWWRWTPNCLMISPPPTNKNDNGKRERDYHQSPQWGAWWSTIIGTHCDVTCGCVVFAPQRVEEGAGEGGTVEETGCTEDLHNSEQHPRPPTP